MVLRRDLALCKNIHNVAKVIFYLSLASMGVEHKKQFFHFPSPFSFFKFLLFYFLSIFLTHFLHRELYHKFHKSQVLL